jgi:hypothetical protein
VTGSDWTVTRHRTGRRRAVVVIAAVAAVVLLAVGFGYLGRRSGAAQPPLWVAPGPGAAPAALAPSPTGEPLPPPDRVRIPAIGVDAGVENIGLDRSGVLDAPKDFARVGWFTGGPAPGDVGPAVFAGHVDTTRGAAVFYRLRDLRPGDAVEVSRGGRWVTFRVVASERYPKERFPTERVYWPTPVPELRLITCGGAFDKHRGSYEDNIVVYAVLPDA